MHHLFGICLLSVFLHLQAAEKTSDAGSSATAGDEWAELKWLIGPATGDLGTRAKIRVPEGFRFAGAADARKFTESGGGKSDGNELGLLDHRRDKWKVLFEFDDIGYVKDDEKAELEKKSDDLLKSYQKGTEAQNKRRKELGIPLMQIVGWHVPPRFNDQTKQLEWSITAEVGGEKFVNYNVRVLGREGVTAAILIEDFDKVDATLPRFREVMEQFNYKPGQSYAEYKQGDKVAKIGLSALVLGGAAAAAYKVGLLGAFFAFFKKAAKLVIAAIVGLGIALKNIFSRMFGRKPGAGPGNV